jgi:hypothetical protein
MRENRTYGSEGGETGTTGLPYPYMEDRPAGTEKLYANRHWSCMSGTGCKCVFVRAIVALQLLAPTGASPMEAFIRTSGVP